MILSFFFASVFLLAPAAGFLGGMMVVLEGFPKFYFVMGKFKTPPAERRTRNVKFKTYPKQRWTRYVKFKMPSRQRCLLHFRHDKVET